MDQNLLNYIKENLAKGVPQDQIRQSLITSGWQSTDIDAAFLQLNSQQQLKPPQISIKEQKSFFNPKILVAAIVLALLLTAGGGAYLYSRTKSASSNTPPKQETSETQQQGNQEPDVRNQPQPAVSPKPENISIADGINYKNPTHGYSLLIPPDWKQKTTTSDNQIKFEDETGKVELQILTLAYTDPAFSGDLGEYNRVFSGEPGLEYEIDRTPVKKIQNMILDKCEAVQVLLLSEKAGYSSTCIGTKRYLTLLLTSDVLNIDQIVQNKPTYDAILATFKFNQFTLD